MKKRMTSFLLSIVLALSMTTGTAHGNVAVNPSSQMHNQGVIRTYIEGSAMRDLGERFAGELGRRGIQSRVFWSGRGDYISGLIIEVSGANKYGAQDFISLHSDAAGPNVSNKMLVLYASPSGRKLAEDVGGFAAAQLGQRIEYRQNNNLYVLNRSTPPAILIEVLNHSNASDCSRLLDHNYRQQVAESLAAGYAKHVGKSISALPITQPIPEIRIPVSANVNYGSVVRLGNSGINVSAVQNLLQSKGYDIAVDGNFGAQTRVGVVGFQTDHNLVGDGVVGSVTWQALRSPATMPRIIQKGDTGRAVIQLQEAFRRKRPGWYISADGQFGAHTDSAVRIFQRENRLTEDGVVGNNTWKLLLR